MQALFDKCFFKEETDAALSACAAHQGQPEVAAVNTATLQRYVERGRARLTPVGPDLVSVSVKEGSQGDVAGLFCGARSLLVNSETGAIHLRGVNKFSDLEDVGSAWIRDSELWRSGHRIYVQRKMAGFVVTLFSTDDRTLRCMTKHALEGPHVEMAVAVLDGLLSKAQQEDVSRDLFAMDATASCECICRTEDFHHPVLEGEAFDNQLIVFAVQRRRTRVELAMPFSEVQRRTERWGLPCTPAHLVGTAAALEDALAVSRQWRAAYSGFPPPWELAEGFVLLVESDTRACGSWLRPLRLKAKAARYVALRSLRSLIRGDSEPRVLLYHKAVMAWWVLVRSPAGTAAELKDLEQRRGVSHIDAEFTAAMTGAQHRRRHRDADVTVQEAYEQMMALTAAQVCGAQPRISNGAHAASARPPVTLLLLCGLPGSGKSTVSAELMRVLSSRQSAFGHGLVLSRDAAVKAVSERLGVTAESSRHKRRRLGHPVHKEMRWRIEQIKLFASTADAPTLVLFDACNATVETRSTWVGAMGGGASLAGCRIVHVRCGEAATLAHRIGSRPHHELLSDAAEAQRALYTISNIFVPPTPEENAIAVDTSAESLDAIVERLAVAAAASSGPPCHRLRPLTFDSLEDSLRAMEDTTLRGLLGIDSFSAVASTVLAPYASATKSRRRGAAVVSLELDGTTAQQLLEVAADALVSVLSPPPAVTAGSPAPSLASRLLSGLRSALRRPAAHHGEAPVSARVGAGHIRWLHGWLFRGKPGAITREAVARALAERFEGAPPAVHVTLIYSSDGTSGLESFWSESRLKVGDVVKVAVSDVLLDRFGVCLSAELPDRARKHQWGGEPADDASADGEEDGATAAATGPHLHITLRTASGVKGNYCGDMAVNFPEWEERNAQLTARRAQNTATRSQDKFINFAELNLSTPLTLFGRVVDAS